MPPARIILETERLLLREFEEADAPAFFLLGSDPLVTRFTGDRLESLDAALHVLRTRPLADYRDRGYGRWACVLKETGGVIGFAGPKYLPDLDEIDLGYRFLPAHWGKGLATEAAQAVVDHAFSRLALNRLIGLVHPTNAASIRVLEKTGGRFDALIPYQGEPTARYIITPTTHAPSPP